MKSTEEILQLLNSNPVFYLATCENNKPHVRGMLLYKADADGIVFHTGSFKSLHHQLQANSAVELCFNSAQTGEQIRIAGEVVEERNPKLLKDIYQHPTRGFLRAMGENIMEVVVVYRLTNPRVNIWKMENNFDVTEFAAM